MFGSPMKIGIHFSKENQGRRQQSQGASSDGTGRLDALPPPGPGGFR